MSDIKVLGIDIAKHVFYLHGVNSRGKCLFKKKVSRSKLISIVKELGSCVVAMEACSSSNHWGRVLNNLGFEVKLIPAQYVKPYVKSHKNDWEDAAAIAEACLRPHMRFVPVKTLEQQDVQSLHRIRQRLVRARVSLTNEIRGLLAEYGIIIAQGINPVRQALAHSLHSEALSIELKDYLGELQQELLELSARIERFDRKVRRLSKEHPVCRQLQKIDGIGPVAATALVALMGDGRQFRNGRQAAAWLGLVPKQYSSGGKPKLGRMSKRGNCFLRALLVQGAKNVVRYSKGKTDRRNSWVYALRERKGANKAAVAVANKNARTAWAIIVNNREFDREYVPEFAQAA